MMKKQIMAILISSLAMLSFAEATEYNSIQADKSSLAFVYKQIPEFKNDATLQLGSSIYLWLTVDPAKLSVDSTSIVSDTIPAGTTSGNQSN